MISPDKVDGQASCETSLINPAVRRLSGGAEGEGPAAKKGGHSSHRAERPVALQEDFELFLSDVAGVAQ